MIKIHCWRETWYSTRVFKIHPSKLIVHIIVKTVKVKRVINIMSGVLATCLNSSRNQSRLWLLCFLFNCNIVVIVEKD